RISRSDPLGVSSVPGVLGGLDLLGRGAFVKWWQGRSVDLGFVAHWFDEGRSFIVVSFGQQSTYRVQRTFSLKVVTNNHRAAPYSSCWAKCDRTAPERQRCPRFVRDKPMVVNAHRK